MTAEGGQRPKAKTVSLYQQRGETSRFIDASINKDGDLVVSGQDVGKAPLEFWGDSDYEFWVYVPSKYKDDVLLALLEELYGGNGSAVSDFRDLLKSRDIPNEFGTWVWGWRRREFGPLLDDGSKASLVQFALRRREE